MNCIIEDGKFGFIRVIQPNCVVALSTEDKERDIYHSTESLELEECTMSVYLKQYNKPVPIAKQVFKKRR